MLNALKEGTMKNCRKRKDYVLHLDGDRRLRKTLLVLSLISFFMGLFFLVCSLLPIIQCENNTFLHEFVFPLAIGLFWFMSALAIFCYSWDRLRLRDGVFDLRLLGRRRSSCLLSSVASFGQGECGSIGFFDKEGSLLLYIPFTIFERGMSKEVLLLETTAFLTPLSIPKLSKEEAENLLCQAGVL